MNPLSKATAITIQRTANGWLVCDADAKREWDKVEVAMEWFDLTDIVERWACAPRVEQLDREQAAGEAA